MDHLIKPGNQESGSKAKNKRQNGYAGISKNTYASNNQDNEHKCDPKDGIITDDLPLLRRESAHLH